MRAHLLALRGAVLLGALRGNYEVLELEIDLGGHRIFPMEPDLVPIIIGADVIEEVLQRYAVVLDLSLIDCLAPYCRVLRYPCRPY